MIPRELEAEILRLYHAEHWRIGTLATQLQVHHSTVRRVLAQAGIPTAQQSVRRSIVDPFIPFIVETLEKYPRLSASRLYEMVRARGYPGAPTTSAPSSLDCVPNHPLKPSFDFEPSQPPTDWGAIGLPNARSCPQ